MAVTRVSGYTRRGARGQSERVSSYVRDGIGVGKSVPGKLKRLGRGGEEGPGDEVGPSDNERGEADKLYQDFKAGKSVPYFNPDDYAVPDPDSPDYERSLKSALQHFATSSTRKNFLAADKPSTLDKIKGYVRHQTGTDLPKAQHGAGRQTANVFESLRQGVGAGTETRPNGRKASTKLSDVEIARRAKKDPELLTEEQLQRAVDLRVLHPKVAGPIIAKRRNWKKGWSGAMQHVAPMSAVDRLQEKVELSVDTARVSTVHSPLGQKDLWNTKGLQLPAYIQNIAKAIMRDHGFTKSHAIATAVSRCKIWAAGGGGVSPEVQAAAAKAIAEWEAGKVRAHSTPNKH